MQHRFGVAQGGVDAGQLRAGDRVDEHCARSGAAELDQIGTLAVAVAGGTFGIDRDGSLAEG